MASNKELFVHIRLTTLLRHSIWHERFDDVKIDPSPRLEMFQRQCTVHIEIPNSSLERLPSSPLPTYTPSSNRNTHTPGSWKMIEYLAAQGQTLAETNTK